MANKSSIPATQPWEGGPYLELPTVTQWDLELA
jgi:hypothetical protein